MAALCTAALALALTAPPASAAPAATRSGIPATATEPSATEPSAAAPAQSSADSGPSAAVLGADHQPHTITFDQYSLMIDGRRLIVWSGEFHAFRLPSPDLWLDILQKLKADGYNAVSLYFDWGYHSPAPGVYDFSGVRDMNRLLDLASRVGIYVIARPGPYINAEVDAGGYPGWLLTQAGKARTAASDHLAAVDDWLSHIDAIIARHQLTTGQGTVILYQIENELAATGTTQRTYLQHLHDRVRADGITVPIFHNDKGRNGIWVPASSGVAGTVPGPVDLYAFDGYPGGTCRTDATPGAPSSAPDWGIQGTGGAKGGSTASPNTPGFVAEFGGGWFDYWGSNGTYPCMAVREGPGYERVFYQTNLANRLTLQNIYMTFGGTSWGWLPAPVVYTSYDYGAAFDEARQQRPKALTMKELGLFVASVTPLTKVDMGPSVAASSAAVRVYHLVNPDTGTAFYTLVHNPSKATTNDSFTFPISTADGSYTVPAAGTLRLNGQDAKTLVADYDVDGQHLVYSTSEIMTHAALGDHDLLLLYGRNGEDGETVLRYSSAPRVHVLAGSVTSSYDSATGDLRLDYAHSGLVEVQLSGGGRRPLTLLLADQSTADTFSRQDTPAGPVVVRGPSLLRTATVHGPWLALTGDTSTASPLQVWAPTQVAAVTWNGRLAAVRDGHGIRADGHAPGGSDGRPRPGDGDGDGSLLAPVPLPGPEPVKLPDLTTARWHYQPESPEASPGFDDSAWTAATRTSTNSTTPPPAGQVVLTADDYGFHHGDVWYRGRYTLPDGTGTNAPASIGLRFGGGGAGLLQAWLDGQYLGQDVLATGLASPPTTGTASFTIPAGLRAPGQHVLSVMVRNDSHNEDGGVNDAQKEGRGLIAVTFTDDTGAAVQPAVTWRLQGNLGGEQLADPVRGAVNNGGLFGERAGWYLPGYPDRRWTTTTLPASSAVPGTSWYRTTFRLDLPRADDASLGLTIGDPSTPRSGGNYRALIFVNGWNLGQYIGNIGPQHTFVLPNGILDPHGPNTLAIAVTSDGGTGNGLETVRLTDLGTVRGGVPVRTVESPRYGSPRVRVQR